MENIDILVANALQTEFDRSIIFHDNLPENGVYPMLSYTDLTESPALHADNRLYGIQHVIRVTIVTSGNAGINLLKEKVMRAMVGAGFMWENTNKIRDDREYYVSMDFSVGSLNNDTEE